MSIAVSAFAGIHIWIRSPLGSTFQSVPRTSCKPGLGSEPALSCSFRSQQSRWPSLRVHCDGHGLMRMMYWLRCTGVQYQVGHNVERVTKAQGHGTQFSQATVQNPSLRFQPIWLQDVIVWIIYTRAGTFSDSMDSGGYMQTS